MDATQDQADKHLICASAEYARSDYCLHELRTRVQEHHIDGVAIVDLQDGRTSTREGLLLAILNGPGIRAGSLSKKPRDLSEFTDYVLQRGWSRVVLTHFDLPPHRKAYDVDLFAALRFLITEGDRPLCLLAQSRAPFSALLPRNHPLSDIPLATVEL